jgi:putative FmdB family regulatory protein
VPTYTYECKKCGHVQDVFHAMSAKPRVTCEACKGRSMTRMLGTGAGLIFKGSGFYETDYKRGNGAKSDTAASSKDGAKSDTKTETKSDSKTGSSSDSKGKSANASAA